MPEGGRLTIQTCKTTHSDIHSQSMVPKPGDYVQLIVRDTGAGMDEETRKRIFEPFFTTKTMGRGTGLGLVSVLAIIKRLGGVIDVESEIEHGTAFKIYLPAIPKNTKKNMADAAVKSVKSAGQTVLLVDDEEVVLDVGSRILQRIGFTVYSAGNGEDALRIYSENKDRIDLVILDMVMPDMGGKIVFERMKQLEPAVKVLLASGYSLNDEATEIMRKGCNGFIQKPYNLEELTAKIDQILQQN
jgi:CheY-like chemotaxis protein